MRSLEIRYWFGRTGRPARAGSESGRRRSTRQASRKRRRSSTWVPSIGRDQICFPLKTPLQQQGNRAQQAALLPRGRAARLLLCPEENVELQRSQHGRPLQQTKCPYWHSSSPLHRKQQFPDHRRESIQLYWRPISADNARAAPLPLGSPRAA